MCCEYHARPLWHSIRAVWVDATGASVGCPSLRSFLDLQQINMSRKRFPASPPMNLQGLYLLNFNSGNMHSLTWFEPFIYLSPCLFFPYTTLSDKTDLSHQTQHNLCFYTFLSFWGLLQSYTPQFPGHAQPCNAEVELAGAEAIKQLQLQWGIADGVDGVSWAKNGQLSLKNGDLRWLMFKNGDLDDSSVTHGDSRWFTITGFHHRKRVTHRRLGFNQKLQWSHQKWGQQICGVDQQKLGFDHQQGEIEQFLDMDFSGQ